MLNSLLWGSWADVERGLFSIFEASLSVLFHPHLLNCSRQVAVQSGGIITKPVQPTFRLTLKFQNALRCWNSKLILTTGDSASRNHCAMLTPTCCNSSLFHCQIPRVLGPGGRLRQRHVNRTEPRVWQNSETCKIETTSIQREGLPVSRT